LYWQANKEGNWVEQDSWPKPDWERECEGWKPHHAVWHDPIRRWLMAKVPRTSGSCIEIGCYPGRYLSVLGNLGYELHGIDIVPQVSIVSDWLKSQGYRVGQVVQADLLEFVPERTYDVVCSFGLIEHFADFGEIIKRQAGLVSYNGYLVLATPNFNGLVQGMLHRWLDSDAYAMHNLEAMRPDIWAVILQGLGFNVLSSGWFGYVYFWRPDKLSTKAVLYPIWAALLMGCLFLPKSAYAPFCGLIARREAT
jgi:2-polyprenyl-3-methyl-5-hydroxy-6-metoxy-1,4-benzoquinol methylase